MSDWYLMLQKAIFCNFQMILLFVSTEKDIPFDKQYECGRVQVEDNLNRVVNGEEVIPPHSQPWMVTVSEHKYKDSQGMLPFVKTT